MSTTTPTPPPNLGYAPSPKRVLWKWSLGATVVILAFLIWQCGSTLYAGRGLANTAAREFHERLNGAQYDEICLHADEGFTGTGNRDATARFLEAVHTKLGNAGASNLVNIRVNSTTGGNFIVTEYKTTFDRGSAVETFTWKKSNDALKLYGYNIQSNALVLN